MNDIREAAVLSALRQQMTIAAAKRAVATGNLANVNTRGSKAQDADFSETLIESSGQRRDENDERPPHARRHRSADDDEGSRGLAARR